MCFQRFISARHYRDDCISDLIPKMLSRIVYLSLLINAYALHNGSKYSIIAILAISVYLYVITSRYLLVRDRREFSKRDCFNVSRERAHRRDTCAPDSYL